MPVHMNRVAILARKEEGIRFYKKFMENEIRMNLSVVQQSFETYAYEYMIVSEYLPRLK